MEPHCIRIGTRGSALATAQAAWFATQLVAAVPGITPRIVVVQTQGDVNQRHDAFQTGEQGLFVRRLEEALADGSIDIAVHSLKDLPSELHPGLCIAAYPKREDPRDAIAAGETADLFGLQNGARVGTCSPRRTVQLLAARADLRILPIRGNIDTRLHKLRQGQYDAIVLAMAGPLRLGLDMAEMTPLPESVCLPAAGQGCLGIQTREGDTVTRGLVAAIDDPDSRRAALAERAFMRALGAGCTTPTAVLARPHGSNLEISAMLSSPDGAHIHKSTVTSAGLDSDEQGAALAHAMLRRSGHDLMRATT
ncbi:MAG: hydroxymethylbilane synthase [Armatimonadetes bacterium]|nr:hydroxymethylbilane synthase [Armatimonadota bacterium]MDE2207020.1 hydroxymethylbilane synthase [Armatimonadota bacterium]